MTLPQFEVTGDALKVLLDDLLNGATFFGSGGGGPRAMGTLVSKLVEKEGMPSVASVKDMADDDWAVVAAGVGSPDAAAHFNPKVVAEAVSVLSDKIMKTHGKSIDYMLAAEIGAGNTFMPIAAAHYLGCNVLDAAIASRAVPKITMSTFAANGVDVGMMALANDTASFSMQAGSAASLSDPMRNLLSNPPFDQVAGLAIWPVTGKVAKKLVIQDTLSKAVTVGSAIRTAPEGGKLMALLAATGGQVLAQGVAHTTTTTGGAFDHSMISITGADSDTLVILSVNENLLASSSATGTVAAAPDLISYMLPDGTTISNVELEDGAEVVVIGSSAGPMMRTPGMLAQFKELLISPLGYYGPTPLMD